MRAYLSEIVDAHRAAVSGSAHALADLTAEATASPKPLDFSGALVASPGVALIAEVKRRSPSKGDLAPDLDPALVARAYRDGGAACLSVLTDVEFFGGSVDDLRAAKAASGLPTLRKDFTVSAADVAEARIMGADAVLLIVAALTSDELTEFAALAASFDLATLVEIHDEDELEQALGIGASLVGINQRDLRTFEVDTERALGLVRALPEGVISVAESGINNRRDVDRLATAGFDAILVGETLVTAPDPAVAVKELVG
jgi:indole-3-glycerol phosphate synthase